MGGDIIDGIKTTYRKYDPVTLKDTGDTTTITHGSSESSQAQAGFSLTDTQTIVAISGISASSESYYGTRVARLTFAIYDSSTGDITYKGPYGGKDSKGTTFRVTANGIFVGFGGYAIDTDSTVKQLKDKKKDGGLYGLSFYDVAYTKV